MLIRISLILAIVAGLAAAGLNLVMVKEKIITIEKQREDEKSAKEVAQADAAKTHKELDKTTADLKTTRQTLATTTTERDQALAKVVAEGKRADKLTEDLAKTRKDRDDAQADLQAYKLTELKPEEIIAIKKQYKSLEDALEGSKEENKLLAQKLTQTVAELKMYRDPEATIFLPAQLAGKVVGTDPKWNFVVLNVGADQGVLKGGQLLVNRGGQLVAKIIIRSVQKDQCVANVMTGWQLGEVFEGDLVIPAFPAS